MTFHRKRVTCPQKMPRRKQDCPKKMKKNAIEDKNFSRDKTKSPFQKERLTEQHPLIATVGYNNFISKLHRSCETSETDYSNGASESSEKHISDEMKDYFSLNHIEDSASPQSEDPTSISGSPLLVDGKETPLDFSIKKQKGEDKNECLPVKTCTDSNDQNSVEDPLDLSVPKRRCKNSTSSDGTDVKASKVYSRPSCLPTWGSLVANFASSATDLNNHFLLTPVNPNFVDYPKIPTPSESCKALERMQELSRITGDNNLFRSAFSSPLTSWQNHWLAKGLHEQTTRDILKCVWCKQSFSSLADLTVHMKEAKHCNMLSMQSQQMGKVNNVKNPDTLSLLKDNMPIPRKLVRGQDVWLGKGVEQTKQILKCMWCGQSFTSLADMTTHMQQTQHYTNIISQEQIISWKSPEDKSNNQSHVNAVLTCKVCDKAFSSLKELSSHMVKNAHYKEHIMKSISESNNRRKPTREKRKSKSLPVRKLLEIERAQNEFRNGDVRLNDENGKISCERCGEKIDFCLFVDHIRRCVGAKKSSSVSNEIHAHLPCKTKEYADLAKSDNNADILNEPIKPNAADSSTSSVLNAIEQLIEKSFDVSGKTKSGRSAMGSSILQRLGIDESIDYSKPLIESSCMSSYDTFSPNFFSHRNRSASESSGGSEMNKRNSSGHSRKRTSACLKEFGRDLPSSPSSPKLVINEVDNFDAEETDVGQKHSSSSAHRFPDRSKSGMQIFSDEEMNSPENLSSQDRTIPCDSTSSDVSSKKMFFLDAESAASEYNGKKSSCTPLSADLCESPVSDGSASNLGSASRSLSSSPVSLNANPKTTPKFHPLAALQKLCEKTESHISRPGSSGIQSCSSQSSPPVAGSILAFSWACNDAVMNDSIMKCAFCDTPFISKGAYRHHLSKIHFVKDVNSLEIPVAKDSVSSKICKSPTDKMEESPHSKFLKYTELAKQLSSKYV